MSSRRPVAILVPLVLFLLARSGAQRAADASGSDATPRPRGGAAPAPLTRQAAAPPVSPRREIRAIWMTRWDFRTEGDVRRAIRWCSGVGLNRIFFQVRGRADAFYRSNLEPWGEELGGMEPGFDPLETAILAARECGVELHAWINVLPGWKGASPPRSERHVFHTHQEWFLVDRTGKRHLLDEADYTILNPCLPEVRAHIVSVVDDLVRRYPVDGIQLDYMRFTGRKPGAGHDVPFDPRTLALFRKYSGGSPSDSPGDWDRFRTSAVDTTVYRIQEAVREARPACTLSVAAIPDYSRAVKGLFQDVVKWRERGWIDEIYPMAYERDDGDFAYRASSALRRTPAGSVIPGIGAHLHESAGRTMAQIHVARDLGAPGYALFAFASLFPSPSHESRSDPASKRLRAALRSSLLATNPEVAPAARADVLRVANPPPVRPRRPPAPAGIEGPDAP